MVTVSYLTESFQFIWGVKKETPKVNKAVELLQECIDSLPKETSERLDHDYVRHMMQLMIRRSVPESKSVAQERHRQRLKDGTADLPVKGKCVTAKNHFRCELLHILMFFDGKGQFDINAPFLLPKEAADILATWLVITSLEKPAVANAGLSSERRQKHQIWKVAEGLKRRYRDWTPAQLPNFPRGTLSRLNKGTGKWKLFSNKKADIDRSKVRMTTARIKARKERAQLAVTKAPSV